MLLLKHFFQFIFICIGINLVKCQYLQKGYPINNAQQNPDDLVDIVSLLASSQQNKNAASSDSSTFQKNLINKAVQLLMNEDDALVLNPLKSLNKMQNAEPGFLSPVSTFAALGDDSLEETINFLVTHLIDVSLIQRAMLDFFEIVYYTYSLPLSIFNKLINGHVPVYKANFASLGYGGLPKLAAEFQGMCKNGDISCQKQSNDDIILMETVPEIESLINQMIEGIDALGMQLEKLLVSFSSGAVSSISVAAQNLQNALENVISFPDNPVNWATLMKHIQNTEYALGNMKQTWTIVDPNKDVLVDILQFQAANLSQNFLGAIPVNLNTSVYYQFLIEASDFFLGLIGLNNTIIVDKINNTVTNVTDLGGGLVEIVYNFPVTQGVLNISSEVAHTIDQVMLNLTGIELFNPAILNPAYTINTLVDFLKDMHNITSVINLMQYTLIKVPEITLHLANTTLQTSLNVIQELLSADSPNSILMSVTNVTGLFVNFVTNMMKNLDPTPLLENLMNSFKHVSLGITNNLQTLLTSIVDIFIQGTKTLLPKRGLQQASKIQPCPNCHESKYNSAMSNMMSRRKLDIYQHNYIHKQAAQNDVHVQKKNAKESLLKTAEKILDFADVVYNSPVTSYEAAKVTPHIKKTAYELINLPILRNLQDESSTKEKEVKTTQIPTVTPSTQQKKSKTEHDAVLLESMKNSLVDKVPVLKSEVDLYIELKAEDCKKLQSAVHLIKMKDYPTGVAIQKRVDDVCIPSNLNSYVKEFEKLNQQFNENKAAWYQQDPEVGYNELVELIKGFIYVIEAEKVAAEQRATLLKALYS